VTGLDDPVAMVEAPNGVGYSLRRGVCIGRNGGVVAAVRSGEVVISEWAMKADGSRDRTQTILRLPKQTALDIEVAR
jgi:type IV pilus assembly protein PilP